MSSSTLFLNHPLPDLGKAAGRSTSGSVKSLKEAMTVVVRKRAAPSPPVSHEQIMTELLGQVTPVDFRALARLDDPADKLTHRHYVVLVVRELLVLAERNDWGLCRRDGQLFTYNGAYWKALEADEIKRFLMKSAERMGVDWALAQHHAFGEHLYKQFLVAGYLSPPIINREVIRINLLNGTFEIGTRQQALSRPDRAHFLTHQLPFAYIPEATAPRWQAFLERVVPDISSQLVLAEYLGYLFVHPAKLKLEKVLLLYGSGANGKSVFFEVVSELLGPENVSNYSLQSLTTDPAYCRAHLATKLVNYASEINGKVETDTFKQLASGEPVEARLPYGQPFIIRDYAKLIFNCNELPTDVEHTPAFFRRFLIVPFPVTIPEAEQDKTLAARIIAEELPGVFNWIFNGLKRLLERQKLTECEASRQQVETFRHQSDSVRLFLEESGYTADPESWEPTKGIYAIYRAFCKEDGYWPVTRIKFTARLRNAGIEETRRNTGKCLSLSRPN